MELSDLVAQARDVFGVRAVFGEPYERDATMVIPVARVQGGAGGGGGQDAQGQGRGSGSGFGINARPVGAFLVRGDQMTWRPAVDVNRVIVGAQVVAIVALFTVRGIVRTRTRAQRRRRGRRH